MGIVEQLVHKLYYTEGYGIVHAIREALELAAQEAEKAYASSNLADRSPKHIAANIRKLGE